VIKPWFFPGHGDTHACALLNLGYVCMGEDRYYHYLRHPRTPARPKHAKRTGAAHVPRWVCVPRVRLTDRAIRLILDGCGFSRHEYLNAWHLRKAQKGELRECRSGRPQGVPDSLPNLSEMPVVFRELATQRSA